MNFSQVATGYNTLVEVMRTAEYSYSEKIQPSWDQIKNHFGGIKGLMERGINKDTPIYLSYNIDKIEFTYEPSSNRIVAASFITLSTSNIGEDYFSEELESGKKIKLIGEAKLKDNPFSKELDKNLWDGESLISVLAKSTGSQSQNIARVLNKLKSEEMFFECIFPDNPTKKTNFLIPLSKISDNDWYKNEYNDLYTLFYDEVETLFNDIPSVEYLRKENMFLVNFLVQ